MSFQRHYFAQVTWLLWASIVSSINWVNYSTSGLIGLWDLNEITNTKHLSHKKHSLCLSEGVSSNAWGQNLINKWTLKEYTTRKILPELFKRKWIFITVWLEDIKYLLDSISDCSHNAGRDPNSPWYALVLDRVGGIGYDFTQWINSWVGKYVP